MRPASARSPWVGLLVAAVAVAATTGVIFGLREVVPVVSTAVLYLPAVLLISSYWGLWLGLLTSVASAFAFNYFHLPPAGQFTIADPQNWVALVVYFIVAVVVSTFADAARARQADAERGRREADVAAALARILLGGDEDSLQEAADLVGAAAGLEGVELKTTWVEGDERAAAIPLVTEGRRVGTLLVPRTAPASAVEALRDRTVPALSALIDARARRAQLEEQVVETRALRRSDVLKTALLRAVSHDLRSPLTAIRTAAMGVGSPTLGQEGRAELAAVIATESDRLARLVENLLDLSRLEAGTATPRPDWCSIDEVVRSAIEGVAVPGASFDVVFDDDLPLVKADAGQLERALGNLLENAARHSGGQPVSVRARAHGRRLIVRVSDRGPGIAGSDLTRIFEPFYRADGEGGSGSGLGLAIARGFVEANGGRLRAQSLPGQGATFVLELPLLEDSAIGAPA